MSFPDVGVGGHCDVSVRLLRWLPLVEARLLSMLDGMRKARNIHEVVKAWPILRWAGETAWVTPTREQRVEYRSSELQVSRGLLAKPS